MKLAALCHGLLLICVHFLILFDFTLFGAAVIMLENVRKKIVAGLLKPQQF